MNPFIQAVSGVLETGVRERLTDDRRLEIAQGVMEWAAGQVKGSGPEVDRRLVQLEKRVKQLMLRIQFHMNEKGQPVLKPGGSDEETLKFLRLGSSWFYGSEDVTDLILGGVFSSKPA